MRTQQVLVTAVLACSFVACVSNRGAASTAQPEPSTAPSAPAKTDSPPVDVPPLSDRTMKTVLESGEGKTYSGDGDCVTIANKFLEDWCAKTLSNTSISMKDGDLTGDDNVLVYAVIARGLLRGSFNGLTAPQPDGKNYPPARHRTPGDFMSECRATSSRNARAASSESAGSAAALRAVDHIPKEKGPATSTRGQDDGKR